MNACIPIAVTHPVICHFNEQSENAEQLLFRGSAKITSHVSEGRINECRYAAKQSRAAKGNRDVFAYACLSLSIARSGVLRGGTRVQSRNSST